MGGLIRITRRSYSFFGANTCAGFPRCVWLGVTRTVDVESRGQRLLRRAIFPEEWSWR